MKKVVLASLLAVAGAVPLASTGFAQLAQGGGSVQMSADEYKLYNDAATATTPAAKAAGFEAYLKAYPNSAVKADALGQILFADSQTGDEAATLSAADRILALDPNNLQALTFEVYYRRADGDKASDATVKQDALDKAAGFAQQGLKAAKPKDMADDAFAKLKVATAPTFYSAIADDDLNVKKDNAGAIEALKSELHGVPVADTQDPAKQLQDVFTLANAYYTSTPPDYLNCAWYATRAANFAPAAFKPTIQTLANYCYKKFHGAMDGYDAMQTAVATSLDPPDGMLAGIKPAPKPQDMVHTLIAETPDLSVLALGDKETALQYGTTEDAGKVFDSVKGKSVSFPDVTVVTATADQLVLMVSDDANASKTPDFTVKMKEPLKTIPAVGDKITVNGTYDSYTASPLMITMTDGEVVPPKPVAKPPVHHTVPRKKPGV